MLSAPLQITVLLLAGFSCNIACLLLLAYLSTIKTRISVLWQEETVACKYGKNGYTQKYCFGRECL